MPRKSTTPDLEAHLGYWLRMVSNQVSNAFARKVEELGVTVAEWVLLRRLLDDEPLSPSRLADRMGTTRGTVTKLCDRVVAKGLVARASNADDGRAQYLSLTPEGRSLVPRLARLADRNEAEFFGHLPAARRDELVRTLQEIVQRRGDASDPID